MRCAKPLAERAILDREGDRCGQAGGDLVGEGGAGQDRDRRLRLGLAGDVVHQLHRRLLHALGAEDERRIERRHRREHGAHMLGGRDDEQGVAVGERGELGGGPDRGVERNAGEEQAILVVAVDAFDHLGLERPQQGFAAARRDLGERRPPGAAADDSDLHAFTPAPRTFSASGSSGQRARAGASSASVRPASKRSAPAQAIIAALSVHSHEGGATKGRPAFLRQPGQRRADAGIGGDPAGDDQRLRLRHPLERPAGAVDEAVDHRLLEGGGDVLGPVAAAVPGAEDGALEAGEGEMGLARAEQRPRQRHGGGIAGQSGALDRGPARKAEAEQFGGLVERLAGGVVDGGGEAPVAAEALDGQQAGNGRPRRAAADRGKRGRARSASARGHGPRDG